MVRHHGLGERGKLYALLVKFVDLPHDLFNCPLATIEDRAQLDCSCPNHCALRSDWSAKAGVDCAIMVSFMGSASLSPATRRRYPIEP